MLATRKKEVAGFSDLLNYAVPVDDGVVLCKDGSLLAGFFFQGSDPDSSSDADKNYLTAMVNNYLHRFGTGWAVWVDAIRITSPGYPSPSQCNFPDPISALIDAERRELFSSIGNCFETEYAIVFSYKPPSKASSKFASLFYSGRQHEGEDAYLNTSIEEFRQRINTFHQGLRNELLLRRMGKVTVTTGDESYVSDELVNHLGRCLTGKEIKIRLPDCPMYMDTWIGNSDLWVGDTPKFGKKYIATISITGLPTYSKPGILSLLEQLPLEYRWSTRFIFVDQQTSLAIMNKRFRHWKQWSKGDLLSQAQRARGGEGQEDLDAQDMSAEVVKAIKDVKSGEIAGGYYTSVIVLMDGDREYLLRKADYVQAQIESIGFHAQIETENSAEAWRGSLPGHMRENVRQPFINSLNLSDLMPLSSMWPGLKTNPCSFFPENTPPLMYALTSGSTPFRVNTYVEDVGHGVILGPTGAGKSTLFAMFAAQFLRYKSKPRFDGTVDHANVICFDKRYSMYAMCKAVGGNHYDIGADGSSLRLCPLAEIDAVSDRLWASEWIELCFELQTGNPMTVRQRSLVNDALALMSRAPKDTRSIESFLYTVQDRGIHDALKSYADSSGGLGKLLNGTHDSLAESYFTVYEIDTLMSLGPKNAVPVLSYLFRRTEKRLMGQPTIVLMDEAWIMFTLEVARENLRKWLKELRKLNAGVWLATQSLSDLPRSGILDVILEQCPTKILLPNKEADSRGSGENPGPADLYEKFGLGAQEIMNLKRAQYKRQYYYRSPLGRRMFDLKLGDVALSFAGVSGIDDVNLVREFESKHGENWPLHWMRSRGVDYEKYAM